jgi:hypothetical protein
MTDAIMRAFLLDAQTLASLPQNAKTRIGQEKCRDSRG